MFKLSSGQPLHIGCRQLFGMLQFITSGRLLKRSVRWPLNAQPQAIRMAALYYCFIYSLLAER
jgi:hypothetical protein